MYYLNRETESPGDTKETLLIKAEDVQLEESDSIPRFAAVCDL